MKFHLIQKNENKFGTSPNNVTSRKGISILPPTSKLLLQAKLNINQPNDKYEQEADAVADKIMRMEVPFIQREQLDISNLQRKDESFEEEELQRVEENAGEAFGSTSLENYIGGLSSGGETLPNEVRSFYEPKFGHDFSNVKVHTNSIAAKSAQSINALAYTNGNNVVFNEGQYAPESENGKKLLAHELTHVVQQNGGTNNTENIQKLPGPRESGVDESGGHIIAGAHFDAETEREINIARGEGAAGTRARLFLTQHMVEVVTATNTFLTNAQAQIDGMDGDPSDYWALVPTLAGLIGASVTTFIPGVNVAIGAAIAVAVQAAVQTTVTAEAKSERGSAKEKAKAAMRKFAESVEAGQRRGVVTAEQNITRRLLTLGVTNDEVRPLLETASDDNINTVVVNYLGIPNPTAASPFQSVLRGLMGQFSAWMARQRLNQGRTRFEQMVGETPGTDQHSLDQPQIDSAKRAAEQEADEIAGRRIPRQ